MKIVSKRQAQIALFFPIDTTFKSIEAAGVISKTFGHIFSADPNIISLPVNAPAEIPKIMYSENGIAQFNVGTQRADFFLYNDMINQYNTICDGLKEIIDQLRLTVIRIGVSVNFLLENEDIRNLIVECIKSEKILDSKAFDMGWLRQYELFNTKVNKWTRIILSDEIPQKRREINIDINSQPDLPLDLSIMKLDEFLKNFYKTIEEDTNYVLQQYSYSTKILLAIK